MIDNIKIGKALAEAGGLNIAIGILCLIFGTVITDKNSLVFILGVVIVGIGVSSVVTGVTIQNT